LLLTLLGTPFERIEADTAHGATRTPEFLSTINANGRVPVLEFDAGRSLPESNAIAGVCDSKRVELVVTVYQTKAGGSSEEGDGAVPRTTRARGESRSPRVLGLTGWNTGFRER